MFELEGKGALVTGASGGIGSAIAQVLHAQGARVVLSGTREEALKNLAATLPGTHVVCADLREKEASKTLVEEAGNFLGQLDILVSNAGITRDALFVRMKDEEDWEEVLNVNLSASFRLCRAVLRGMMSRRWGRIICISSVVGSTGNPGQANYVAAKAGLEGMVKSLALEVATRNVTVNAVAPGFIKTPMTAPLSEKQTEAIRSRVPVGTLGEPENVAAAVVYLASAEASYVTGQTLHVNGGLLMT